MYAPIIQPPGAPYAKLRVELVPSTCWASNVRAYLSEHYWRKLAREIIEMGDGRCQVCSGSGRGKTVHCHEVWAYNEAHHIQELLRLRPLCPMCHYVTHLGRSIELGYERQATGWLARVNGWNAQAVTWYKTAIFKQWSERSRFEWALDLSVLGEAYEIPLERLGVQDWLVPAAQRQQLRDDHTTRVDQPGRRGPGRPRGNAARQSRTPETSLPASPAQRLDWVRLAESGHVWEFVEGQDFKGSAANFRARKKTEARKSGVDFNSTEVQRNGKTVLKVLAFKIPDGAAQDTPPTQNDADADEGLHAE